MGVIVVAIVEWFSLPSMMLKDENKVIATMMPCTISVYEKADGKTYIGTMNA